MLFHAKITAETMNDENALCEQLYIFLKSYIPRRLVYENQEEREDCMQDTIMYMLDRYNKLTDREKSSINIEKFFYNRARSYISIYLRGIKRRRELVDKYTKYEEFLISLREGEEKPYIDKSLLTEIIESYNFTKERMSLAGKLAFNRLVSLGYSDPAQEIDRKKLRALDPSDILTTLSYTITDEYLLRAVDDRGDRYK